MGAGGGDRRVVILAHLGHRGEEERSSFSIVDQLGKFFYGRDLEHSKGAVLNSRAAVSSQPVIWSCY